MTLGRCLSFTLYVAITPYGTDVGAHRDRLFTEVNFMGTIPLKIDTVG